MASDPVVTSGVSGASADGPLHPRHILVTVKRSNVLIN